MKILKWFFVILLLLVVLFFVRQCMNDNDVPVAFGDSVAAQPLPALPVPQHPLLAEGQRSGMHAGSHNSDVSFYAGPLGNNTVTKHRKFSALLGVTPNISFDSKGRLITVSMQFNGIELHLLDADTLETLAEYQMPKKSSRDNSGGGYFHLDKHDRPILAPNDNSIKILDVVEDEQGIRWQVVESYELGDLLPEGANIHDVMPDWQGNLWFVTTGNVLGYRHPSTGEFYLANLELPEETIQNSFAVAADGVYVISDHALYRFDIDSESGAPIATWREPYERGTEHKPGMLAHGSGTSPTLIGDDLIGIVDDASPRAHILVYQRLPDHQGSRLVCKEPIFKTGQSATENSLMVYGNSMIVQNDYGHVYTGNALQTAPGVTRVDMNEARDGCTTVWESQIVSQSLPRLSTATGLVYFYTFAKPYPDAGTGGWYLTALDFESGEKVFDRLIGKGSGGITDALSSFTAPVVLGPNGGAYVGIRTGLVYARDEPAGNN